MENKNFLTIALIVLLALGLIFGGLYFYRQSNDQAQIEEAAELIGGEKDANGCLVAAGYSWCEAKEKCLRTWEEDCAVAVEATESDIAQIRQAFVEKYQKKESEVQITIEKFDGSFARGGVKFAMLDQAGEGGIFLAYKDEGIWKLAFDGNGMISCSEMDKFSFPKDMTLGCFNDKTEEVKPGAQLPNPASANCVEKGGVVDIRTGEDGGQYGVCKFEDGSECDEWALFRGECKQGE